MKKWLCAVVVGMTMVSGLVQAASQGNSDDTVTIYFARHGKTLLNDYDRVQGWVDSPLTEAGRLVTRQLGEGLKDISFDSFYTSDAGRQRETMSILLEQMGIKDAQVHEEQGLREMFFGGFEGGTNQDMKDAAAKVLGYKNGTEMFAKMKEGVLSVPDSINSIAKSDTRGTAETFDAVKIRTQRALQNMVKRAQADGKKTILAVSSGSALQIMIYDLTDNNDKNKPLSNATVVKITYRDGQYHIDEIGSKKYIEQGIARLNQQ